jgi:hypothetical protein
MGKKEESAHVNSRRWDASETRRVNALKWLQVRINYTPTRLPSCCLTNFNAARPYLANSMLQMLKHSR